MRWLFATLNKNIKISYQTLLNIDTKIISSNCDYFTYDAETNPVGFVQEHKKTPPVREGIFQSNRLKSSP